MEKKLRIQLVVACGMTIVGAGVLIAGFIVPPLGIIDHSILIAAGEILTFVGSLFGIDYNYKYKITQASQSKKKEYGTD
jgi:hypothetical protein